MTAHSWHSSSTTFEWICYFFSKNAHVNEVIMLWTDYTVADPPTFGGWRKTEYSYRQELRYPKPVCDNETKYYHLYVYLESDDGTNRLVQNKRKIWFSNYYLILTNQDTFARLTTYAWMSLVVGKLFNAEITSVPAALGPPERHWAAVTASRNWPSLSKDSWRSACWR